ncbi:GNAT family N-acetyltransferase [Agromyces sp. SYSU T00194]|uniref:GNAT family N-acetyltransferase n=1 Tax=Agromyces chitinivorans TaxID=3158560 RepID=UPI00339546EB
MEQPRVVTLRAIRARDLDELPRLEPDPDEGPDQADARWRRLLAEPGVDARLVRADGEPVGTVVRHTGPAGSEITCRIRPDQRGRGIGTRAVRLFLDTQPRPVHARTATDDLASIAVLEHTGFTPVADDADGIVFRLD